MENISVRKKKVRDFWQQQKGRKSRVVNNLVANAGNPMR